MSNGVIDRREVIDLLSDLVRIPSVNPRMGTGTGKGEIARYLADRLRRLGLAPLVTEVQPGRPNVLATVPGKPGRPHEPSPLAGAAAGLPPQDRARLVASPRDNFYTLSIQGLPGSVKGGCPLLIAP